MQLAEIRAACIKALCASGTRSEQARYTVSFDRPIRLADVLLAIGKTEYGIDATGHFLKDYCEKSAWDAAGEVPYKWNLPQDDLTQQSDETIKFLADLLA